MTRARCTVEHVPQDDASRRRTARRHAITARVHAVVARELIGLKATDRADLGEALIKAGTHVLGTARDAVGAATFLSAHSGRVVPSMPPSASLAAGNEHFKRPVAGEGRA